ncbi:MAG TPA: alpha/beta hydrolase-fold protein [Bacteroidales bacterium]|nr:alpha/beta hydrolase-fold protein [Bacteroidales bacterium]HRW95246.1 alpha/beta hydrolase-fold protein [Bacteroidales bacterium]
MKNNMMNVLLICLFSWLTVATSCDKPDPPGPEPEFIRYSKDIVMQSKVLNASVKYSVYLPDDYLSDTTVRYAVVYLLHGLGDDNNSWNDIYLRVSSLINELEHSGEISKMIYVMPQGFRTYYVNRHTGTYDYMDMFVQELVPHIDRTLRTVANRDHRAVVGYSMGGYGAMILPSKHPELFSVSVPLSMSFRTDKQYMTEPSGGWDGQWGYIFGGEGRIGEARLTPYYKEHSPFCFFNAETAGSYDSVKYFLDCGDDEEQLLVANDTLHVLMRSLGIDHEFRVRNGAHTSDYWRKAMYEVLPFIENSFNGLKYKEEETIQAKISEYTYLDILKESCGGRLYFPADYKEASIYTALYYVYSDMGEDFPAKSITQIKNAADKKGYVLVTCNSDSLAAHGMNLQDVIGAAEKEFSSIGNRKGVGILEGGRLLFNASTREDSGFSSVLLAEAAMDDLAFNPSKRVSYNFCVSDQSRYYFAADFLYRYCKEHDIKYEYRVYNGIESANSVLYAISLLINNI